jgi:outer membrane lipoprotein LolB
MNASMFDDPVATPRRRLLALAGLPAIVVIAAGCAPVPPGAGLERMHAGRFAVTVVLGDQRDSTSGRFTLGISGERAVLDLATPLGSTLARIERGPEGVLLRTYGSGAEERRSADGAALTESLLGWPLPVDGLADWIVGRPAPGSASTAEPGDPPRAFTQGGWRIEIQERFADGQPSRLLLTRAAQPARGFAAATPAITLRLLIDDPSAGS